MSENTDQQGTGANETPAAGVELTRYEQIKLARAFIEREFHPYASQVANAFYRHRGRGFLGGEQPRHYAQNFDIGKNDDLLPLAYVFRSMGGYEKVIGTKEAKDIDADHDAYMEAVNSVVLQNFTEEQIKRFQNLSPHQVAMIEEKAKLLVGRMKTMFGSASPNTPHIKFDTSERKFINDVETFLTPEVQEHLTADEILKARTENAEKIGKKTQFLIEVVKLASNDAALLAPKGEGHQTLINLGRSFLQDAQNDNDDVRQEKKQLRDQHKDVLLTIEADLKRRRRMRKIDSTALLQEILCNENAIIFQKGGAYCLRTGNNFILMGGKREERLQAARMALKYLQDRGDPWRGLVRIFGAPEEINALTGDFREMSVRMLSTGHNENFLVSEIKMDVIGNSLYNHGRGYVVVRTIKCNEDGEVIYRKRPDGTSLTQNFYECEDGSLTLELEPKHSKLKLGTDGKPIIIPAQVPETTETLVYSNRKCMEADTPLPLSYIENHDLDSLGIKYPAHKAACVADPYAGMYGSVGGDYVLCGSFKPEHPNGETIHDRIYDSCLFKMDSAVIRNLARVAQAYERNEIEQMFGREPTKEEMMNFYEQRAKQGLSGGGASDFQSAKLHEPKEFAGSHGDAQKDSIVKQNARAQRAQNRPGG